MGVNTQHLVMVGVSLPPKNVEFEQIENDSISFWEEPKGFKVAYDGMSEKYVIAGKVLAATYDDRDWLTNKTVNPIDFKKEDIDLVKENVKRLFNLEIQDADVKLYAFTHNS